MIKEKPMAEKFYRSVIRHRKIVLALYMIAILLCLWLRTKVGVNSDLAAYLPEDSRSTVSLHVMKEEFTEKIPNARLMVRDISLREARQLKKRLEEIDGVLAVMWVTDSNYFNVPLEFMSESSLKRYYRDGNALYTLTLDTEKGSELLEEIRSQTDHKTVMAGEFVQNKFLVDSARREVIIIVVLAVLFAIFLLILTLDSYAEPFLLILCLVGAVILNAGTNIVMGTVSTMTNIAASVLQMAVSVDYFIFILHRYREFREEYEDPEEAMVQALRKSRSSVLASSVTTVIGFMALTFMKYRIGFDLGIVLSKGVLLSLLAAFTLLPCTVMQFRRLIDRTSHRPLIRSASGVAGAMMKVRIPAAILFVALVFPSIWLHTKNSYYYGSSHSFRENSIILTEEAEIEEVFGLSNSMVLMVPAGRKAAESMLIRELQEMENMSYVTSLTGIAGSRIPTEIIPKGISRQLLSDNYSRIVLTMTLPAEDPTAFDAVNEIKRIAAVHYGDDFLLAGSTVSTEDLRTVITGDTIKVNLIGALAVFMVLVLTFRGLVIPLLLTMTIEGCIWISMAIPYLTGQTMFYIGYLIISSILLGSTVDYAILVSNRFLEEYRACGDRKEAIRKTISVSAVSIMISGLVLTFSGVLLHLICSNGIMAQMGLLLARGTFIAMTAVLFALPQMLLTLAGRGKVKG